MYPLTIHAAADFVGSIKSPKTFKIMFLWLCKTVGLEITWAYLSSAHLSFTRLHTMKLDFCLSLVLPHYCYGASGRSHYCRNTKLLWLQRKLIFWEHSAWVWTLAPSGRGLTRLEPSVGAPGSVPCVPTAAQGPELTHSRTGEKSEGQWR